MTRTHACIPLCYGFLATIALLGVVCAPLLGADLLVDGKTMEITGSFTFNTVTVRNGGRISHRALTVGEDESLELHCTTLTVDSTSAIDVSGKGYPVESGPGGSTARAGGSYGGQGALGHDAGAVGNVYGDPKNPSEPGSGGGHPGGYDYGGRGGGYVRIYASSIVLDGSIRADGEPGTGGGGTTGGGGSGGSIYIETDSISGTGSISAKGGDVGGWAGGGGGGRIAIYYQTADSFDLTRATAPGGLGRGGNVGGAGTVFFSGPSDTTLRIGNLGTQATAWTDLIVGAGLALAVDTLEIASGALVRNASPLDVADLLRISGAGAVLETAAEIQVAGALEVKTGGKVTHAACGVGTVRSVQLDVGSLVIDGTGTIDVSQKGYPVESGPGGSTARAGGSYGGQGALGHDAGAVGNVYGDPKNPSEPGSGGGHPGGYDYGGRGGGYVRIYASSITLDGTIRADGGAGTGEGGTSGGGGSGGAIYIETGTISGTGSISARGGDARFWGGGGGGGRIAIYYDTANTFDLADVTAPGGVGESGKYVGGAGTVFLSEHSNTTLRIDNSGTSATAWTDLLAAGGASLTVDTLEIASGALVRNTSPLDVADLLRVSGAGAVLETAAEIQVAGTLEVEAGGKVTHAACGVGSVRSVQLDVGSLVVDGTSTIDVSGRGYPTGSGPGGSTAYAGGSYGGQGGRDSGTAGSVYGDAANPSEPGSGGGDDSGRGYRYGGRGGGYVRIYASSITLDGTIRADGERGTGAGTQTGGGGSGGSIYIETDSISGSGAISGDGGWAGVWSGGGGGGRIAIYYQTADSYDLSQATARGGTGDSGAHNGGAGTVFLSRIVQQNQPPIANAGPDQSVSDTNGDGRESVTLNGSLSHDTDGTIQSYVWTENAVQLATGSNATVTLSVGTHTIVLTVADDDSATGSDTAIISVAPVSHVVSAPNTPSGPSAGQVGATLNFSIAGSTCTLGHMVEYQFDWGDSSGFSAWSASTGGSHAYSTAGTYQVKVHARCSQDSFITSGWSSTWSVIISVAPPSHTVNAPNTPSGPSAGQVGATLNFAMTGSTCSLGHTVEYQFDWDDGSGFSAWSASTGGSHAYSSARTYQVKAHARCSQDSFVTSGWSSSWSVIISAASGNQPPDTRIVTATIDEASGTAQFTWSGTDDRTATQNLLFQYRLIPKDSWSEWATTAVRGAVSYTGLAAGNYRFEVHAKDADGAVDPSPASREFTVLPVTASHLVSSPNTPAGPPSGQVSATLPFSTTGATCSLGHTVEYQFDWDDGSGYSAWSASPSASHAYSSAGTYHVSAHAQCSQDSSVTGEWSSAQSVTISVTPVSDNQPPLAAFVFTPISPRVSDTVEFNASRSSDPDSGDAIVSYSWDWNGDGEDDYITDTPRTPYSFGSAGNYRVILTVRDRKGAIGAVTDDITVQGVRFWQKVVDLFAGAGSGSNITPEELDYLKKQLDLTTADDSSEGTDEQCPDCLNTGRYDAQIRDVLNQPVDRFNPQISYGHHLIIALRELQMVGDVYFLGGQNDVSECYYRFLLDSIPSALDTITERTIQGIGDAIATWWKNSTGHSNGVGQAYGYLRLALKAAEAGFGVKALAKGMVDRALYWYLDLRISGRVSEAIAWAQTEDARVPISFTPEKRAATREYFDRLYAWYGPHLGDRAEWGQYVDETQKALRECLIHCLEGDQSWRYVTARPKSPIEVRVMDSQGRIVGLEGGVLREELPSSACNEETGHVVVVNPTADLLYAIVGTADGTYGLDLVEIHGQEIAFRAEGIPIGKGETHTYHVDWRVLAAGGKGVTIDVDSQGDGTVDRVIHVGGSCTATDLVIASLSGTIRVGPNPVPSTGCAFFYTLPSESTSGFLLLFDITGRRVLEIPIESGTLRFPDAGTWDPADEFGVPLANGPYVCVLAADGQVVARVKLVIQR